MNYIGQDSSPDGKPATQSESLSQSKAENFITCVRVRSRSDRGIPPSPGATRTLNILLAHLLQDKTRAHRLEVLSYIIGTPVFSSRQPTSKQTYIITEELQREHGEKGTGAIGAIERLIAPRSAEDPAARGEAAAGAGPWVGANLPAMQPADVEAGGSA